jgi:hypothetical protein
MGTINAMVARGAEVTYSPQNSGVFSGVARTVSGAVLYGVEVRLGFFPMTASSLSGSFELAGIQPGTYSVTFSRPGYVSQAFTNVVITPGGNTTLDVRMVRLLPLATVYTPHAPSTVSRGRSFTVYGYLAPRHKTGTYLVSLQFFKKDSSGKYVYHHSVSAKRYDYSTSRSKYKAKMSLPHSGKWRVRAYHADSGHRASYSGYDYITVK